MSKKSVVIFSKTFTNNEKNATISISTNTNGISFSVVTHSGKVTKINRNELLVENSRYELQLIKNGDLKDFKKIKLSEKDNCKNYIEFILSKFNEKIKKATTVGITTGVCLVSNNLWHKTKASGILFQRLYFLLHNFNFPFSFWQIISQNPLI